MSVKYALMALLAHAEKPASALQAEYLAAMEHTQTLNIGQVSQTLSRLERSGLIATAGETTGSAGHHVTVYSLTEEGHKALHTWWIEPTLRGVADRDELLTKITLAATDPTVNLLEILDVAAHRVNAVCGNTAQPTARSTLRQRIQIQP